MTPQDVKLWARLRQLRELGYHFRRQSPILSYIVDFECRKSHLIVEVDGGQHNEDRNQERDARRDAALTNAGYRVLRFWNHEIAKEIDVVMEVIHLHLDPTRRADARHPPLKGREGERFES
jgi:very-short-patch-repair endonuclease